MGYEWLALAAASLWAIAALISAKPARHLGALTYSRWRMFLVSLMLGTMSLLTGGWQTLPSNAIPLLAISGLIGIFVGDTALFMCMNRLGPRRSALLFSCHALFSALLGIWLFSEHLTNWRLLGAILVLAGVMLAILFGRDTQHSQWEQIRGNLMLGISLGLTAAFCQSVGAIIAKPVMISGEVDAVSASGIRMGSALLAHCALRLVRLPLAMPLNPINRQILAMIATNGFLAMGLGMTLILMALRHGEVGMVAILSATTPVILLPLLWWHSGERPSLSAWAGAVTATLGMTLILGGNGH
ncbi:MAG: DMT family transporter [Aeromonas sp.]